MGLSQRYHKEKRTGEGEERGEENKVRREKGRESKGEKGGKTR